MKNFIPAGPAVAGTILALSSLLSPTVSAQEQRPRVVHGPSLSCVHIYNGDTTSVTCDESVSVIAELAQRENARIDEVNRAEYRKAHDRLELERERQAADKQIDEDGDAQLLAKYPKGFGCIKRRIGNRPLTTAKPADYDACEKAINQDARRNKGV